MLKHPFSTSMHRVPMRGYRQTMYTVDCIWNRIIAKYVMNVHDTRCCLSITLRFSYNSVKTCIILSPCIMEIRKANNGCFERFWFIIHLNGFCYPTCALLQTWIFENQCHVRSASEGQVTKKYLVYFSIISNHCYLNDSKQAPNVAMTLRTAQMFDMMYVTWLRSSHRKAKDCGLLCRLMDLQTNMTFLTSEKTST